MPGSKLKVISVLVVSILFIFALVGAGVLVYYEGDYVPLLDTVVTLPFLERSPDSVVTTMQSNLMQSKTAHWDLDFSITEFHAEEPITFGSHMIVDGGIDSFFTGTLVSTNEIFLGNRTYLFDLEVRAGSDTRVFQIQEVPAFPSIDLRTLEQTWFSMAEPNDTEKKVTSDIVDLVSSSPLFSIDQRLPDDTWNGQRAYRYDARVHAGTLASLNAILQSHFESQAPDLSFLETMHFELWIGKEDLQLYYLSGTYAEGSVEVLLQAAVSDQGKNVKIEIPTQYESLNQFSETLLKDTFIYDLPIFLQANGVSVDRFVHDEDKDGLYQVWEWLLGTDPARADTDGDGFNDGNEVRNGYNPKGEGLLFTAD